MKIKNAYFHLVISIVFVFILLSSARTQENVASDSLPPTDYRLVWQDEFNGTALDARKWRHRYPGPRRYAINHPDAVSLDGQGHLVLRTELYDGLYHTAMIGTEGLFEISYGYFECRARLQREVGHWSAFWLQSPAFGRTRGNTAVSGAEIDIFEYLRKEAEQIHHTLHWDGYREYHKSLSNVPTIPGLGDGWHTFGLLWTEEEYVFYVDGKETWRTQEAISNRDQYLVLSLEVDDWAGDITKAELPDSFYVDYVRVYQKINEDDGE
jgi:beta-glucanase (GH16 family)